MSVPDPEFQVVAHVVARTGDTFRIEGCDKKAPKHKLVLEFARHPTIDGAWTVKRDPRPGWPDRVIIIRGWYDTNSRPLIWRNDSEVILANLTIKWFWDNVQSLIAQESTP